MGGIGFILAITILVLILINVEFKVQYLALLLLMLAFAAVGLGDDWLKIIRRKNLGLTFWQKIILQVAAASFFSFFLVVQGHNLTLSGYLQKLGLSNPYLYQLLVVFMIVGSANATNLTDGLNGLLAGTAGISFLALAIIAARLQFAEASVFALIVAGAVIAFLYYNFPRAKLFMGDVGSLAIGAALAGLAILLHKELVLAVVGGVFVIEALSVMIQVSFYKLFKARVFKMAPLHHHFELLGMKETGLVICFWMAAAVLGLLGIFL